MRSISAGCLFVLSLLAFTVVFHASDLEAVTDGDQRLWIESLDFSEPIIKAAIYARSRHDVFHKSKRRSTFGIPRVTNPLIYEPDVYTWKLAMAEHHRQMAARLPKIEPLQAPMIPDPMAPPAMMPMYSTEINLSPLGDYARPYARPLPDNAAETMARMLNRASGAGLNANTPLKAESFKQRFIEYRNNLTPEEPSNQSLRQLPVPVLPENLPAGRSAFSFDRNY